MDGPQSNSFYLVKKFPLWRISILADIRPMGYKLSCSLVVFGLGKDILFKSVLGRCGKESEFGATLLNAIQEDKLV